MNQEKIGRFIAEQRKKQNLTQEALASKLGITKNAVSKWERGISLMDLSLIIPLSKILNISVSELLQGEKLKANVDTIKNEENIINIVNLNNKKLTTKKVIMGLILLFISLLIIIMSMCLFPRESLGTIFFMTLGIIISLLGVILLTSNLKSKKKYILDFIYLIFIISFLLIMDFISVKVFDLTPRLTIAKETRDNIVIYKSIFYNYISVNNDTINEYHIIDYQKKLTYDTISKSPFNQNKSGINNLLKYKSTNNIKSFLYDLPLYNKLEDFEHNNNLLTVKYNENYNDDSYIKKSILYNSVYTFALFNITNIQFIFNDITFNISKSYISKDDLFDYTYIEKYINSDDKRVYSYAQNMEEILLDDEFTSMLFKSYIINNLLKETTSIAIGYYNDNDFINTKKIINQSDIQSIIDSFSASDIIVFGPHRAINADGESAHIRFYEDDYLILEFYYWRYGTFGLNGKEYTLDSKYADIINKLVL